MVRPRLVTRSLLALLVAALPSFARAQGPRPFDALLPAANAAGPGTYALNGTVLVPVPDQSQIPVLLQADVIRGAERAARVGVVVAADVPRPAQVRLVIAAAPKGGSAGAVVADTGGAGPAGPLRLVREIPLEPGDYELRAVVGESREGTGLIAVARSRFTVPDLRAGGLAVTPVVLGEAASADTVGLKPFVFGRTTLTPALTSRVPQGRSVSVAFRVYNWAATGEEKPDLTVEYLFYERGTKGLHFFNKVKPQQLNAETLGPSYDPSGGSVAAGMTIPLAAFTFGDFELVVRVTDDRAGQGVEQRADFTVVP
jgi:hypothetical protein